MEKQYKNIWTVKEEGMKLFRNPGYGDQVSERIN
jgi:hypothetical protein